MKTYLLLTLVGLVVAGAGACLGQSGCGAEVKLMLVDGNVAGAVTSLQAKAEEQGTVYLYDTAGREMLAHGILLRVRSGKQADLTVKLRLGSGRTMDAASAANEKFKCEVDRAGNKLFYSYSQTANFRGDVPADGAELRRALTPAQLDLLREAGVAISWGEIRRGPAIRSTSWQIARSKTLPKLSLEWWQWSGGSVLELSAKVPVEAMDKTLAALQALVAEKGLAVSPDQRTKSSVVLGEKQTAAPQ